MDYKEYEFDDISQASEPTAAYRVRNDEMNLAWQFIASTGVSVFLTGKAGTGKTTFLKRLRELSPKRMVVLAPTGVAAINAEGQTIHSFFQLPFGPYVPGSVNRDRGSRFKMSERKKDLIRTLDLLVIDEVSMVRADMLDQIDNALRSYRDPTLPFGGVQVLLIGDLMQLSPVAKPEEWTLLQDHYDTPYFFSSHALERLKYVTIELKHIYRQQDVEFIDLLARIRDGNVDAGVLAKLNERYIPGYEPQEEGWIRLTTHNYQAQQYNERKLVQLSTPIRRFAASVKGDFPELSYPTDKELVLKIGAQVMFVKNDPSGEHLYYNGKIGIITDITDQYIEVSCDKGAEVIKVTPVQWDNARFTLDRETKAVREEIIGSFIQYPLRLAWAITVHKSQGLTFDRAVLDVNSAFAHGQVYVALSRCRTLQGIVLSSALTLSAVKTDKMVNTYIDRELAAVPGYVGQLPALKYQYALHLLDQLYTFSKIDRDTDWLIRVVEENLSRAQPELLAVLKGVKPVVAETIVTVAYKFRNQYRDAMLQSGGKVDGTPLEQRVKDSAAYFSKKLIAIFQPVFERAIINIGNKQVAETYNNALKGLQSTVLAKAFLFEQLMDKPFTVATYLSLKARAELTDHIARLAKKRRDELAEQRRAARAAARQAAKANADSQIDNFNDGVEEVMPKPAKPAKPKPPKRPKPDSTYAVTLNLYQQGKSIAEIAAERNLQPTTIESHLARYVEVGDLDVEDFVPLERRNTILQAISTLTGAYTLTSVREILGEEYSYSEIRMTIAAMQNQNKSADS